MGLNVCVYIVYDLTHGFWVTVQSSKYSLLVPMRAGSIQHAGHTMDSGNTIHGNKVCCITVAHPQCTT